MRTSKAFEVLKRPLDWIFSAPSHVAVLRAMMDCKEGMSGRAVARQAAINHQACALALIRLEKLGVVQRTGSGKTQLIRLNSRHFMVREMLLPLLRKERNLFMRIRREIAARFRLDIMCAVIFGSAARGNAGLGSDIDLLIIVPGNLKGKIKKTARHFGYEFIEQYGIRLSPLVMTVREARKISLQSNSLIWNAINDGISLSAKTLKEVLA